jgi:hypothetical protein
MVGEPKFYLRGVEKVELLSDGRTIIALDGKSRQFGPEDWKKIYKAKGDLSAIGFTINHAPVEHFGEFVSQERRGRTRISLVP